MSIDSDEIVLITCSTRYFYYVDYSCAYILLCLYAVVVNLEFSTNFFIYRDSCVGIAKESAFKIVQSALQFVL